jgi:GNAT superfamily N-acetyltransferase
MITIIQAGNEEQVSAIQALMTEYWTSFGFTTCFQGFDQELASLPGKYAPPSGRLLLASVDGEPAGCVALRPFDEGRGEIKRLYVRPQFRGQGVAQALMDRVVAEGRGIGYRELIADTLPDVMATALRMYERMGFERIAPYSANPTPEAEHIRLRLAT